MKHKQIFFSFCCLLFVLSCVKDDYTEKDKPYIEPLTISNAKSWYNANFASVPRSKSLYGSTSEYIDLIPQWHAAALFSDSLWYAVESNIKFESGQQIRYILPEVAEYIDEKSSYNTTKQILRHIVLRNKESGDTYAFLMLVMPSIEYMERNKDQIEENKYLTRKTDLDGLVVFMDCYGDFINAWVYEQGDIIAGTHLETKTKGLKVLKEQTYCWRQDVHVLRSDGELELIGTDFKCETKFVFIDNSDDILNSGSVSIPDIPSSGGNSNTQNKDDKEPKERTDCEESATQNAENAQSALDDVGSTIDALRNKLNEKDEYGASFFYDTDSEKYYTQTKSYIDGIHKGTNGSVILDRTENTAYTAHTHHKGLNSAPSCGDLIGTANIFMEVKKMGGNYKGTIILGSDGTEYLIAVNNSKELENFYNANPNFKERNGDLFKDKSVWDNDYRKIKKNLVKNGYSENDAQAYALTYIADKYKTGLKISMRKDKNKEFKEQKTDVTEDKKGKEQYTPQICK